MEFVKYRSITGTWDQEFMDRVQCDHPEYVKSGDWVVTEKIHGTNMQLVCDGKNVELGKRSTLIDKKQAAYDNSIILLDRYKDKLLDLFPVIDVYVKKHFKRSLKQFTLYGEYFGGYYRHPDVKRDVTAIRVQKGVSYSPSNEFAAFDIAILLNGIDYNAEDLSESAGTDVVKMLPFDVTMMVLDGLIPTVPVLYEGSFEECLNYPNDSVSKLHTSYGLPAVDDNIIEGTVIRPVTEDLYVGLHRLVIKNKNCRFLEHQRAPKIHKPDEFTQVEFEELEMFRSLINYNRVEAVLSKLPRNEIRLDNFPKLQKLFKADVNEEYYQRTNNGNMLSKNQNRLVTRYIDRIVSETLKCYLMQVPVEQLHENLNIRLNFIVIENGEEECVC